MKKFFIILGIIILILGAICIGIILNGHYFEKSDDLKGNNTSWMNYIRDDVLLNDVVIPGSHDAGTCNMNWLGRTQGYSVGDQLKMGARYFDLRVNKTEDGYYMYHAMFNGEKFEDVLSAITSFIKTNTTETLILDFQHFSGGSEADVLSMIDEALVLSELVIKNETSKSDLEFISELTLGEARGKCVILFGNAEMAGNYSYLFPRNDDECTKLGQALDSCYISEYNKMKSDDYIETALPYYYENIKEKIAGEGFKGLFVLQGQLTDGYLIFGPYSKEKKHDTNMSKYISEIKNDEERLALTNIIMRDFLTTDKCENIIELNLYKGNVKAEYISEFEAFFN